MTKIIKIGDIVEFKTGMVCRVVADDEATLYVDTNKMGIEDVGFYLESEACRIVKSGIIWVTSEKLDARINFLVATHVMNYFWVNDFKLGWGFVSAKGNRISCDKFIPTHDNDQLSNVLEFLGTLSSSKKLPNGTFNFTFYKNDNWNDGITSNAESHNKALCLAALELIGLHIQVVSNKTSGLVTAEPPAGATFLNFDPAYDKIDWSLVSETFKVEFFSTWESAYKLDCEPNWYHVLDELGWMINQGYFTTQSVFDRAYASVVEIQLEEISS
jgi:hypothetical protein